MHFAAAADNKRVGCIAVVYAQRYVAQQLAIEAVADLTRRNKFALASRERACIDRKGHFNRRFGNFYKRQRDMRTGGTNRISDIDILNAREHDDIADCSRLHLCASDACELVDSCNFALF